MRHWSKNLIGKTAAWLLTLCLCAGLLPLPAAMEMTAGRRAGAAGYEGELFRYSTYEDGVCIDGFSAEYLASLSAEEKEDVAIVIPAQYQGKPVRALGSYAFSTAYPPYEDYEGVNFTSLDFSEAIHLREIKDNAFFSDKGTAGLQGSLILPENLKKIGLQAFMGCSGFSGDLILPDGLESMDQSAFYECSGLTGKLVLPAGDQFTTLPRQAFTRCGFTGELVIPDNITTIGRSAFNGCSGFSGKLSIPDTVTTIDAAAFMDCNGFSGTLTLPSGMTAVADQSFKNCSGLNGALYLHDKIAQIGSEAFYGTGIQTVYLPADPVPSFTNSGSAFNSCASLTAIVCQDQELYNQYKSKITATTPKTLLSYPVQVSFAGSSAAPVQRLYGRPFNLMQQADGVWSVQEYTLPECGDAAQPGYEKGWSFTQTDDFTKTLVRETTLVQGDTLWESTAYSAPQITLENQQVDKSFDGESVLLTVHAQQPLDEDKIYMYYDWHKVSATFQGRVQWSKSNTYEVKNVADSATDPWWYQVTVYVYEKETRKQYYTSDTYYFDVNITKQVPSLTPTYRSVVHLGDGLPDLSVKEENIAGTITWDGDQTPVLGDGEYRWTFTPEDSGNVETVSGQAPVRFVDGLVLTPVSGDHGSIAPATAQEITAGGEAGFTFTPQAGYRVEDVKVDGISQGVVDDYTFTNVQSSHTLEVSFCPLTAAEIEAMIDTLPDINNAGTIEQAEQAAAEILTVKCHTESASGQDIDAHSEAKLNDALASLPQIKVKKAASGQAAADGVDTAELNSLLSNMSAEEAAQLKEKQITSYELTLSVADAAPNTAEGTALKQEAGRYQSGRQYEIHIQKEITLAGGGVVNDTITQLNHGIALSFPIPDALLADTSAGRVYRIVRLHQQEDGTYQATVLADEQSGDQGQITISSDRFSLYSLMYLDTKVSYQVRFESGSKTQIAPENIPFGDKITKPSDPQRNDDRFTGWYRDKELTTLWDFEHDQVFSDMTLYAGWESTSPAPDPDEDNTGTKPKPEDGGGSPQTPEHKGEHNPPTGDQSRIPWLFACVLLGTAGTLWLQQQRKKA